MSLIQVLLGLLTVLSPSLAWPGYPPWIADHEFICFEYDDVPVDTRMAFKGRYCQDKMGNKYPSSDKPVGNFPEQQTSCCQCLEYRCRPVYECKECDYKDPEKQKKCEEERKRCLEEQSQMAEKDKYYVYWSTTVSDNCCLHCNNTVYKADTVINTVTLKDKCDTEETSVCRKIPGLEKAKIETEFRYGVCCNDDVALQPLRTTALQPSTCSKRECVRPKLTPFAIWVTFPYIGPDGKEIEGCDCCKIKDEKTGEWILVPDKYEFKVGEEHFECCRGEVVMKVEKIDNQKPAEDSKVMKTV